MCKVHYVLWACSHMANLSEDCEVAETYGALFIKLGCPNYTHHSSHSEEQCGRFKQGFYCARTQDGVVIDRAVKASQILKSNAMQASVELNKIKLDLQRYAMDASKRKTTMQALGYIPTSQQLQEKGRRLTGLLHNAETMGRSLVALLQYAHDHRERLKAGASVQPLWNEQGFDLQTSVFPLHILQPCLPVLQLPRFIPAAVPAFNPETNIGGASVTSERAPQPVPHPMNALPNAVATPRQQVRPRQNTAALVTPGRQKGLMMGAASPSGDKNRVESPEGETPMQKAHRLRNIFSKDQLKITTNRLFEKGYDVETHGTRPPPKQGNRRTAIPMRTPSKVPDTPAAATSNVRRSARTQNTKPNYAASDAGSDLGLNSRQPSPDRSDGAWQESPDKTDGSSPLKTGKGNTARNRKTTVTGSPAGSPFRGLTSLSSTILEYKKRTGKGQSAHTAKGSLDRSFRFPRVPRRLLEEISLTACAQIPRGGLPIPKPWQPPGTSTLQMSGIGHSGLSPLGPNGASPHPTQPAHALQNVQELAQHIDPQLIQKLNPDMIESLTRVLHEKKDTLAQPATAVLGFPITQQSSMPPTMTYPSKTTQQSTPNVTSDFAPPQPFHGQRFAGASTGPSNFFHNNYQQGMAALPPQPGIPPNPYHAPLSQPGTLGNTYQSTMAAAPPPQPGIPRNLYQQAVAASLSLPGTPRNRSNSTGVMPLAGMLNSPGQGSSMRLLTSEFQPHVPSRPDYEGMRRSFSSMANLTPNSSNAAAQQTPDTDPKKRETPSTPDVASRKRPRLSFPGQDDAPILKPPTYPLPTPTGLPAGDQMNYNPQANATGAFQTHNPAATAVMMPNSFTSGLQDPFTSPDTAQPRYNTFNIENQLPQLPQLPLSGFDPQDPATYAAQDGQDDAADQMSEPDWSLLNDDVF